ncbi:MULTISPECIES: phasin family protein [unclassified Inquilinus]|jgi:phasin family protein|uniref:phasin family protein n=1 Tax=unclassified Inquilinus TaxID=2645927 RepID=UPI003F917A31
MTTSKTRAGTSKVLEAVESNTEIVRNTVADTVKTSQAAVEKNLAQGLALSKEHFEKTTIAATKGFDDLVTLAKGNVDAFFASAAVFAQGTEQLSRAWFALQQGAAEQAAEATRSLFAAKTLREVVDLQSTYSKTAFDGFVAESSKLSELGLKVTNDAVAPIAARVNVAVEKLSKPLAA